VLKKDREGLNLPVGIKNTQRACLPPWFVSKKNRKWSYPPCFLPRYVRKVKIMKKIASAPLCPLSSFVFISASLSVGRWGV